MRAYGKVEVTFWQNAKVRKLSREAREMLLYLYACPHGNAIGCFVLPLGYIADDLEHSPERVSELVAELVSKGFIDRDETTRLTRLVGWWGHNTIENGNVAKAAARVFGSLPECEVKRRCANDLDAFGNPFLNEALTRSRTRFEGVSKSGAEPEPLPEPSRAEPQPPSGQTPNDASPDYAAALLALDFMKGEARRHWGPEHEDALRAWRAPAIAGWLSDGTEPRIVNDAVAGALARLKHKGKPLPRTLEYFAEIIAEAKASTRRRLPTARARPRDAGTDWSAIAGKA